MQVQHIKVKLIVFIIIIIIINDYLFIKTEALVYDILLCNPYMESEIIYMLKSSVTTS